MVYGTAKATKTETSGEMGAPQQFSIQNSRIAFETLSSRLYSDPIRAVIRELSCNAYDAHVVSGKKDMPFVVSLPTSFDPSFRIRDFGPGMDHEQVMSLYCTYFASDKTKRNDAIGAFGLGSKSPFAYFLRNGKGGVFSVTSYQGGRARTYTAFIDDGFPKVEKQFEADTQEPDGLEVTFPAEQKDVWEFENKSRVVFEFFDPLPKLNKELGITGPAYSLKTPRWGLREVAVTAQGSKVRAVMGGVAYAVGEIDVSRINQTQQRIFGLPLDIFLAIGDVNPAVSRESLQLDEGTIAAILKALDEAHSGLIEQVKKKIDEARSPWEGRLVVWNLLRNEAIGKIVNEAYDTGLLAGSYSNFNLDNGARPVVSELDYSSIQVWHFERTWRKGKKAEKKAMFESTSEEQRAIRASVKAGASSAKDYDLEFEAGPDVAFVLNDMKPGRATRYVHFFVQNKAGDNGEKRVVYLVSGIEGAEGKDVTKETAGLLSALGCPPTILASSLKEKYDRFFPKYRPTPLERGLLTFKEGSWYPSHRPTWRRAWAAADASELANPGIKLYVTIEGRNREAKTGIDDIENAKEFVSFLAHLRQSKMFGLKDGNPVYGLRKNAKLRKDPNWMELKGHVETVLKGLMTPAREAALSLNVVPFRSDWESALDHIAKHLPLGPGSQLQEFAVSLAAARKEAKASNAHLAPILETMGYKAAHVVDFNELWKKVGGAYPVLKAFEKRGYGSCTADDIKILVEYARMTEQDAQKQKGPAKEDLHRARKAKAQREYYARRKKAALAAKETFAGYEVAGVDMASGKDCMALALVEFPPAGSGEDPKITEETAVRA
jgi:hypothetical protein